MGGKSYRLGRPLNYEEEEFQTVLELADRLHAPEEMWRFIEQNKEHITGLMKQVDFEGVWDAGADETDHSPSSNETEDVFKILTGSVNLFGRNLTSEYLVNVERFHQEHVQNHHPVELLHVILNGHTLLNAGRSFNVFDECIGKYGREMILNKFQLFELLEHAVNPPDVLEELRAFANTLKKSFDRMVEHLNTGLGDVQKVIGSLLFEYKEGEYVAADIPAFKSMLNMEARAADARYRRAQMLQKRKREEEEEEEEKNKCLKTGDDSDSDDSDEDDSDEDEGSEYEEDSGNSDDDSDDDSEDELAEEEELSGDE